MRLFRRRREEQQPPARHLPMAASDARNEGDRCRDEGLWDEASTHYRRHLDQHPADFAIWVQLGNCLKEASSFEEARAAYWQAIALDGGDPDILLQLGHLQKLMGRHDEAAEAYRASLSRQPHGNPAAGELEHLLSAPSPALEPSRSDAEVEARLSVLEAQLSRLEARKPEELFGKSDAPPTVPRQDGPVLNVLVDGATDPFLRRLLQSLAKSQPAVRLVRWHGDAKEFRLLAAEEIDRLGLPRGHALATGASFVVSLESCGPHDWIVLPCPPLEGKPDDLCEMKVILAARQLGMRSAFIFHGADPLRLQRYQGQAAEVHERYMQGLILADAIFPVSTLAANDLRAFLAQHQCADKAPPIHRILPPLDDCEEAWLEYARRLRSLLADAIDAACRVPRLYFLVEGGLPPAQPASRAFVRLLAQALAEQGTSVVPVRWDAEASELVHAETEVADWGSPDSPRIWGAWIAPGQTEVSPWIVEPDAAGARVETLDAVSAFAKARGLRVAAVLGDVADRSGGSEAFPALAGFDKVLMAAGRLHREFEKFLLAWRGRLHSAEHRFKRIALPNEQIGRRRRSMPRASRPGLVDVLIFAPPGQEGMSEVIEAATEATGRFAGKLAFSVMGRGIQGDDASALEEKASALPNIRWLGNATDAAFSAALETSDFAILTGSVQGELHRVGECLSRGVPCLVRAGADVSAPMGGVVFADLSSKTQAANAILTLCDEDWRRCLSREAASRPVRSWEDFARDIGSELANDRLVESLHAIEPKPSRDVYALLPNLQKRPKLSLCISTYNRAGWVQVNLRNIFSQIPEERSDLEVLLVDNTSTDNTAEVVTPFLGRSDFRYLRNPRNVGMLGNLAVTAQRARGEYVWILGDDDLTRPGVIESVLKIIDDRPRIALIYMNYGYTSEADPGAVVDLDAFLANFNVLEPAGPDIAATVKELAAKCENFFTAIYSHVYRRDHALRAYCQDTSGRIFSTMLSCVPTAHYVLNYMADEPAYWIGAQALVVNSNVSWQAYGVLLDLEQLPRTWDLAERMGTAPEEVDQRRANRLWLVEMMWREIFGADPNGNSAYFSASRVLTRLKHLAEIEKHIPEFVRIYRQAQAAGHPAADMPVDDLFGAFRDIVPPSDDGARPQ
jgi:hypothetical protein